MQVLELCFCLPHTLTLGEIVSPPIKSTLEKFQFLRLVQSEIRRADQKTSGERISRRLLAAGVLLDGGVCCDTDAESER